MRIDGSRRIPPWRSTSPGCSPKGPLPDARNRSEEAAQEHSPTPRWRHKGAVTSSYVIRVRDPESGISNPKWVGGFATQEEAKAARDEGRVKARRGEYIDRNQITVTAYLNDWIDAQAMEIKPRVQAD